MDPITIIGGVATTLKIVKEIWEGLQWMHRIYETHTKGDKTLRQIRLECDIYSESIKTIGQWLIKNQAAKGLTRQMRTTNNAITLVQVSMANLLDDLRRFQCTGDLTTAKDSRLSREKLNIKRFQQLMLKTAKLQWFQETMRLHLVELRAHAATLHLTLGVIELTGHTQELKGKAPEILENKTGKLEKRLLLRQIITKALEVRRAEIMELAGRGEPQQVPHNPFPGSTQNPSQKLTFYDVVQLARQQALVEKTRKTNEDLIDLSDTSQPLLLPVSPGSVQSNLDLLDFSIEVDTLVATQESNTTLLARDETGTSEPNPNVGLRNDEPISAGQDASSSQKSASVDLLGLVEHDASQPDNAHKNELVETPASKESLKQSDAHLDQSSQALTGQDCVDKMPDALGIVTFEASTVGTSDAKKIAEDASTAVLDQSSASIDPSTTELVDQEEAIDDTSSCISPASSIIPSVFSHSSSSTAVTGSSLSGITEEDIQARNSSSQTSLKSPSSLPKSFSSPIRRKTVGLAAPSTLESPIQESDAEFSRSPGISSPATTHTDLVHSEDSVSLCPPTTQPSGIDEPDEQGIPWIVQAARDGNEQMIRKLLVSGAAITAVDISTRRHALIEASIQGHQTIVDLLVEEGCPLEYPDVEGSTALHHACQRGHLTVAKSLIAKGALINTPGAQGQTALHLAMQVPHQNVVMLLIQHKANVNIRDASFRTPLHIGASHGNVAMCNYLLDEGAQLDSREANSKTPLQLACEVGHYDLVQMMLHRSNLNSTSMTFLTAFFAAVENGHIRIAESFFLYGLKLQELKRDAHRPVTLAAKSGFLAMVELVIQEKCDVNARDENGWNALHFASYYGHYQVIELLIASGVSARAITLRKETPLLFAVRRGHFAVAERLLRSDEDGSLVSAEDEHGQQPVHHTVRAGSVEIFNLLMSNGGKINVENSFGWQPLHIATAYGHLALVERLLQQGANIEGKLGSSSIKKDQTHKIVEDGYWAEARRPYPGSRPLHLACEYSHEQIANHLISKGAKMEAVCGDGWQPLHHAAYFGSSALVETLLEGSVNPHATTNEGKTALALEFCTSGDPIGEDEKERVRIMLREAMDRVRKQKSFKVALKRGSTAEEKNNLVRAVVFSMNAISRPPLHRAMTTTQASDPSSTSLDMLSSSHRPRLPHLPHTSPPPLQDSRSMSNKFSPPTAHLPLSQVKAESPALSTPTMIESNLETTEPSTPVVSSTILTVFSAAGPPPSSDTTSKNTTDVPASISDPTPHPSTFIELSPPQPAPKIKRRTTFGLSKPTLKSSNKPSSSTTTTTATSTTGLDIAKLTLLGSGSTTSKTTKPAFEFGKQTLELGTKTLEFGKQGLEISKVGLEKGKVGLGKSKQGLEKMQGGWGAGMLQGKAGMERARKLVGGRGMRKKVKGGQEGGKEGGEEEEEEEEEGEDGDDGSDDDAGSGFSLGDFADLGNDDF